MHLELLAGHTERRGERTLRKPDTHCRGRGDAGHHDHSEALPSGPATHLGLHISSFSDVHLLTLTAPVERTAQPGRDGRSATSSGRRAPALGGANCAPITGDHPERQPLVAPDTHHAQPCWTGSAVWAKTPCPRAGAPAADPARWGPKESAARPAVGVRKGPSVADRGAFSPPAQGASLLGSNGRITEQRPTGLGRRRSVANRGGQSS